MRIISPSGFFEIRRPAPRIRFSDLTGAASLLFAIAIFYTFIACLLIARPVAAASTDTGKDPLPECAIPPQYGEVIYRINENSPRQIYIIGISHRDPQDGTNTSTSVQTQAEIFRIGEWLNRNRGLELLLPEGYFSEHAGHPPALPRAEVEEGEHDAARLNNVLLLEKLADDSHFINAEMLLMELFDMRASQIEDRQIYNAVRTSLSNLGGNSVDKFAAEEELAELQYLQEIRTAMLLQKIPAVIEDELNCGAIRTGSAMFTIGLSHIHNILHYFQEDAIMIDNARPTLVQGKNFSSDLNLLKQGYGISVIIPRNLADDKGLLQAMNLDRILLAQKDLPAGR